MPNKTNYFIGIPVPKKESKLISKIRKNLENKLYLSSPPHITLVPPFYVDNALNIQDYIKSFSFNPSVFKVEFNSLRVFRHKSYTTLVLVPKNPSEELQTLYLKLYSFLQQRLTYLKPYSYKSYVPHLTLANKIPYEDVDKKYLYLESLNLSITLKISSLVLYSKGNSQMSWIPELTVPFML